MYDLSEFANPKDLPSAAINRLSPATIGSTTTVAEHIHPVYLGCVGTPPNLVKDFSKE